VRGKGGGGHGLSVLPDTIPNFTDLFVNKMSDFARVL
jgi:hypothetical protein